MYSNTDNNQLVFFIYLFLKYFVSFIMSLDSLSSCFTLIYIYNTHHLYTLYIHTFFVIIRNNSLNSFNVPIYVHIIYIHVLYKVISSERNFNFFFNPLDNFYLYTGYVY